MKTLTILSASLNPDSKSLILAKTAKKVLDNQNTKSQLIDMKDYPLPLCDGAAAYGDDNVKKLTEIIENSSGILIATPIYTFNVNAVLKNFVELTGSAWKKEAKTVAFLCAAGGDMSYMSVMSFANSLMLDFRSFIVPRFAYATGEDFKEDTIANPEIQNRVEELTLSFKSIAEKLS